MNRKYAPFILTVLLGFFSIGCAGSFRAPAVYRATKFVQNATNPEPERLLRATLQADNIHGLDRLNPHLIEDLAAKFDQSPTPERALALAELSLKQGKRGLPAFRHSALMDLRNAAAYASFASSPPLVDRAAAIHNDALEEIIRAIHSSRKSEPGAWLEHLAKLNIEVDGGTPFQAPERLERVDLAANFQIQSFQNRYRQNGLGVPLITQWINEEGRDRPEFPAFLGKKIINSVTAVATPTAPAIAGAWRTAPLKITLINTQDTAATTWAGQPMRLAYDRTADIADLASENRLLTAVAAAGVLQSALPEADPGIYTRKPYQKGKIPVILVHGLNSSPATWMKDLNELDKAPELSQRYQFWAFFYPTGQPIPVSAHRLRVAIQETRDAFDPLHEDPAFDQMVLIGHSLGGILARIMTLESGEAVWNAVLAVPSSELQASPHTQEYLRTALLFHPVPCVARTIYIAAPHRGSPVAEGPVGQLTTRLSRPSPELTAIREELTATYGEGVILGQTFRSGFVIQNLRQDSLSLQAIANLPSNPSVPYHSIILQRLWRDTDGLVSYESAHLDGAQSEILARSRHTRHEIPEVIHEVKRILAEHLLTLRDTPPSPNGDAQSISVGPAIPAPVSSPAEFDPLPPALPSVY